MVTQVRALVIVIYRLQTHAEAQISGYLSMKRVCAACIWRLRKETSTITINSTVPSSWAIDHDMVGLVDALDLS